MNKLLGGEIVAFEALNPSTRAGSRKDGMHYFLTLELHQEDWLLWADAHEPMILNLSAVKIDDVPQQPPAEPAPVKLSSFAKELRLSGTLRNPKFWAAIGTDATYQHWCREGQKCATCHRPASEYSHVRHIEQGAGVGIKPEFSGIPSCHECHHLSHNQGWQTLADSAVRNQPKQNESLRDWQRRLVVAHLVRWNWDTIKAGLQVESMATVTREQFTEWVLVNKLASLVDRGLLADAPVAEVG